MKNFYFYFTIFLFLIGGCGKKLPPTSPDRWPPKVLNVEATDKHHLSIYFSERIDTLSPQRLNNFIIINPENSETTSVIYSERAREGDEIMLTIPELEDRNHLLLILNIADVKGNIMKRAEKSFVPTKKMDTIPPVLTRTIPSRIRISASPDSIVTLRFSEPMDSGRVNVNDFILTNLFIDSLFNWNETLTEIKLHYRLLEGKMCKLFILPLMSDLSGNPTSNMKILTFTTDDSLPKNRLNIKFIKNKKKLRNVYAFLRFTGDSLIEDIVPVDTASAFSFFFAPPDTYLVSVFGKDSLDTTGLWCGEKKCIFIPDTTRSMNDELEVHFSKKGEVDANLYKLYQILVKNIKRR